MFSIDSFEEKTKELIAKRLLNGVSQRKIVEELKEQNILISDMAISRWWKENKNNYECLTIEPMFNTDKIIDDLIDKIDKKNYNEKSDDKKLVVEQVLLELTLQYTIEIEERTKLKQKGEINHYPIDLIGSLKTITELYLKISEENKGLKNSMSFKTS